MLKPPKPIKSSNKEKSRHNMQNQNKRYMSAEAKDRTPFQIKRDNHKSDMLVNKKCKCGITSDSSIDNNNTKKCNSKEAKIFARRNTEWANKRDIRILNMKKSQDKLEHEECTFQPNATLKNSIKKFEYEFALIVGEQMK